MSGKKIESKKFRAVEQCCKNECFKNVTIQQQEEGFSSFWENGNYNIQNVMLSSIMTQKSSKCVKLKSEKQAILWEYSLHLKTTNISVCQKFLCHLLQINKGRFATVQRKIITNEALDDNRGKHENHFKKLTEDIKELILLHCELLPHSQSHYKHETSNLNYFDHPDLDLKKLYNLFLEYYTSVTQNSDPPISEETYSNYFNYNLNFTFKKPRTDVCNICFKNQNTEDSDPDFLQHVTDKTNYSTMKSEMLSQKEVLLCEFDYGQNLPLPKIPVCDQFYKRLFGLNIFNIHVFNDNNQRSYMFPSLEGLFKKGGNTTSNCLLYVIEKEFQLSYYNKVYLFSDSCGGQNKNYLLFSVLLLLAVHLQVEINHLYPVRGHSYCQCDRNFGMYGSKKKKVETIETAEDYINIIKRARNPPFTIVDNSQIEIKDFEAFLKKKIKIPEEIKISKAVKIDYYPNGSVNVYYSYHENPVSFSTDITTTLEEMKTQSGPTSPVGISSEKIEDVKSLLCYLTPKGKRFFSDIFSKTTLKTTKKSCELQTKQSDKFEPKKLCVSNAQKFKKSETKKSCKTEKQKSCETITKKSCEPPTKKTGKSETKISVKTRIKESCKTETKKSCELETNKLCESKTRKISKLKTRKLGESEKKKIRQVQNEKDFQTKNEKIMRIRKEKIRRVRKKRTL